MHQLMGKFRRITWVEIKHLRMEGIFFMLFRGAIKINLLIQKHQ